MNLYLSVDELACLAFPRILGAWSWGPTHRAWFLLLQTVGGKYPTRYPPFIYILYSMTAAAKYPLPVRQSPAIDTSAVPDETWVRDKTIVITGGASGFGERFFRRWAADGATVLIGDIDIRRGDQLVREVSNETGNPKLHFFHCDVTDWQSQVQFFKDAVRVSPHGGIDTVVANAGIVDPDYTIETPRGLDGSNPPPPNLAVLDVNLKGVLYTSHLALFYLAKNPQSAPADPNCDPTKTLRDRHLLLMSSMAGIAPIPTQTLYATSKHGVVGLYRNLRCSSFSHGVRTNLICPYFMYVFPRDSYPTCLGIDGCFRLPKYCISQIIAERMQC